MNARTLLLLMAVLATAGCKGDVRTNEENETGSRATGAPSSHSGSHARVEDIDNEKLIAWMYGELAKNPGSAVRTRLVSVLFRRGQLRGNLADFQEAIRHATVLIDQAPDASILKLRARAHMSLHHFAAAEADIARASKYAGTDPVETSLLQVDIDLSNGKYLAARDAYVKALEAKKDPGVMIALANLEYELGDSAKADALFDEAAPLIPPANKTWLAWYETQRGIRHLDSGELDLAKARFSKALEHDPRSYLAREHMAEVAGRLGNVEDARKRYEEVIAQTGAGEFLSALASIEKEAGRDAEAKALIDRAKAKFEEDLAKFPEATWQHMGDFLVEHRIELDRARDMLKKNADARPNVSSWLALAEAELAAGDAKAAAKTIDKALATPVRTANLHWTAAEVYEAAGRKPEAAEQRKAAEKLNPKIASM